MKSLAINGGKPVRTNRLNYGRQTIDEEDIEAVCEVLRSDFLTTGPKIQEFEQAAQQLTGCEHAVAVSNGTAGLHTAMNAIGIEKGDEVIVPTLTFAASANCALYQEAMPVFVDVDPESLTLCPKAVEQAITPKTKAIIAMDYAGQPCDYSDLRAIASSNDLRLVADACHSLGATYQKQPVGSLADLSVFSFHPVKPITTGEGGMITTNDESLAAKMKQFRNHGISVDHRARQEQGSWIYEITNLGYNYRLTDMQSALGITQLKKLPGWVEKRRDIASAYDTAFNGSEVIRTLALKPNRTHAYHLYTVQLDFTRLTTGKARIFQALHAEGIGVNVHYIPVHLHPLYRNMLKTAPGLCPHAEKAYEELLSLPIFPTMTSQDVEDTITAMNKVVQAFMR